MRLVPVGMVEVEAAASDMGPGTYTSMTQVAAETLGLSDKRIVFRLGRSEFPPTPPHGGSMTMASVGSAVRAACLEARRQAMLRAMQDLRSPAFRRGEAELEWIGDRLGLRGSPGPGQNLAEIASHAGAPILAEAGAQRDPEAAERYSMHAFGAAFVGVAFDPDIGTIRNPRHSPG